MIQAKNIYKSFKSLNILKGIDINVKKGEIIAITGSSGSGKSTLLQILGSLEPPTSQKGINTEIKLFGQNIQYISNKKLSIIRNKFIGFIFQFHHLFNEFTALENVCLPGYIGNRENKSLQREAKDLLYQFGLKERLYYKPSDLSGGEKQRVSIARALINHPKIIFADEPYGGLDEKNSKFICKFFFSLRKNFNQTFIIVTHNLKFADIADRKFNIHEGYLNIY